MASHFPDLLILHRDPTLEPTNKRAKPLITDLKALTIGQEMEGRNGRRESDKQACPGGLPTYLRHIWGHHTYFFVTILSPRVRNCGMTRLARIPGGRIAA